MTIDEFAKYVRGGGQAVAPEIIRNIESEFDDALPSDYLAFLQQCNGGEVSGRVIFGTNNPLTIAMVAGGYGCDYYLTNCYEDYWGRIPEELLWTMSDSHGNGICLGISGNARNFVYLWSAEGELSEVGRPSLSSSNLTVLANSFSAFVAGLTQHEAISRNGPEPN